MSKVRKNYRWENDYKVCPGCKERKHRDEYYNTKGTPSGKTSRCIACVKEVNNAWNRNNPEARATASRQWREKSAGRTYKNNDGYINYIGTDHPICNPSGLTRLHRLLLWDKVGGGTQECHWCGRELFWASEDRSNRLTVDHLNGIRDDNRLENLVPCCHRCNSSTSRISRRQPKPECSFDGCTAPVLGKKDLCRGHYNQQWHGKELTPIQRRTEFLIDGDGRECTECGRYKGWSEYYLTSVGTPRAKCKACCIARQIEVNKGAGRQ